MVSGSGSVVVGSGSVIGGTGLMVVGGTGSVVKGILADVEVLFTSVWTQTKITENYIRSLQTIWCIEKYTILLFFLY